MSSSTRHDFLLPRRLAVAARPPVREHESHGRLPVATSRCPCGGGCPRCGDGMALDAALRRRLESRLGAPLAGVRVHADAAAARAVAADRAHAFALGEDVFFAAGKFAPHTEEGSTRLAHELVHVVQQRRGRDGASLGSRRGAEREARELGAAIGAGQRVTVRAAAAPAAQHDGPDSGANDSAKPASADAGQLRLDPEIERLALQHYIRWWLGSALVLGTPPSSLPAPSGTDEATGGVEATPGGSGGYLPPLPPALPPLTLTPDFFAPLPPDPFFLKPDVGALFAPFGARGAPVGASDFDVVMDMYRRNSAIASQLPDLRGMAPSLLRPLIPLTWRRDIAGALTGAGVDAALKHDFMSPIEIADLAWEGMTGASTTMIPLPSFSF